MAKKEHKSSVDEQYLVERHLKLEGEGDIPWDQIEKEIDQLMGIDEIHLIKEKHLIKVTYDSSYKGLEDIEEILEKHFIHTAENWWNKTKKSWYIYTDENLKDHISQQAWSCHQDDPSRRTKK